MIEPSLAKGLTRPFGRESAQLDFRDELKRSSIVCVLYAEPCASEKKPLSERLDLDAFRSEFLAKLTPHSILIFLVGPCPCDE